MDFIESQASKYPDCAELYNEIGTLYQQRLWHQLTEKISEFVMDTKNRHDNNMIDLYHNFITQFEAKINQLKLVQITAVIAQQFLKGNKTSEYKQAVEFMTTLTEKRGRLGEEAYVVARMAVAELYIRHPEGVEDALNTAKDIFEESRPILQKLEGSGAETVVNSSFHRVATEYYKVKGQADMFYKAALQFLAYTPVETLEKNVQVNLGIDMSLAALVGDDVYNFGEVLSQPILTALDGTEFSWLHELLQVYSAGDIDEFNRLYKNNEKAFNAQPVLVSNLELLRQKLALLCLMQIVFVRPPEERNIKFSTVAEAAHLEIEQVEWLLMRAMSKGLIKGTIDEIEQVVNVSWLKPRVLDVDQMSMLRAKLSKWRSNVEETLVFIENETPELFQ